MSFYYVSHTALENYKWCDSPYVVWMNGKRVNLPKKDVILLVNQVGEDNIPPADMRDIHRGWLFPYFAEVEEGFPITD